MRSRPVLLVAIASAGPFFTLTAVLAVGPLLVEMARDLGVTAGAVGQLVTAAAGAWAVTVPLVGPLSDRHGRRPALLAGLGLLAGASVVAALSAGYPALLGARLVLGVGAALVAPNCVALVSDHFPPGRRGRLLAITTMGIPLSALVGLPLVTLVAARWGWRGAFATTAVLFGLLGLAVALAVPPSPRHGGASYLGTLGAIRGIPAARAAIGVVLLDRLSVTAVMTYLPARLMAAYGIGLAAVAPVLAVVAVGMLAGQLAGGLVAERRDRLAWAAGALAAAGLAAGPLFAWAPGLVASTALAVAYGAVNAVSRTPFVTLMAELDPRARATMVSFWSLANQVGATAGAAAGALLIGSAGYAAIGWLCLATGLGAGIATARLAGRVRRA